ncbi:hypothetical protein ABT121_35035 [Streptomyces sp. NPDC001928]|uniref:hypothetical protein n=1 Tax=Streptomyces sp. NPDC001928 TaxID=3154404 RepID=UPI0033205AA7
MRVRLQVPTQRQAGRADLYRARQREELLRSELPRAREAALAWRNGLAALLAGLIGFGLVKGRSDVSGLQQSFAVSVGVLLLVSLLVGTVGTLWLMSAAYGLPAVVSSRRTDIDDEHAQALRATAQLRRGIGATLACAAILVTAVAITWYGPGKPAAAVQVTTPAGTECGSRLQLAEGKPAVLDTRRGPLTLDLQGPVTVRVVSSACPGSP